MRKQEFIIATFVVVLFSAIAFLWFGPSGLQKAPDITFKTIDGKQIDLKSLKGKPVLVTFWATSCPGCIKEMPHLIELYHELHNKGLEIIGVAMPYDRPDHVLEMSKRKNIPYPIVLDIKGEAVSAFGHVRLTPSSFLINPESVIIKHKIGEMDMKQIHNMIISMLPK
jgi:peroxiredoxin